jgi:hypothetical protein
MYVDSEINTGNMKGVLYRKMIKLKMLSHHKGAALGSGGLKTMLITNTVISTIINE